MSFSMTARLVALGVFLEWRQRRTATLPDATIRLAARATPAWLRRRGTESLLRRLEAALLPGIGAHYVARKVWFWRVAQRAIDSGVTRAIVLAPGCDGIAVALQATGVDVVEVLHPNETASRARLVAGEPAIERIACDLAADVDAVRRLADDPRPTLWIAEAVLMYLPPEAVAAMLREIAAAAAPQTLLFSAMQSRTDGAAAFGAASPWVARLLACVREPFRWALSSESLREALARVGYVVVDSANEIPTHGFCAGEALFLAERDGRSQSVRLRCAE